MNYAQLFAFLFITFVAYCVTNVSARGATYRKKVRKENERKCNEEIMKKDFITINDKIVCDKTIRSVTKEYMKQICPAIIDLTLKEITEYYVIEGLTKEEFQDYIIRNISHAYMSKVYTYKNIPTYRPNMKLVIDINDIYTYQHNHCQQYFVDIKNHNEYKENLHKYKQEVHEHFIKNDDNLITIETKPYYDVDKYDFQKVLCPTIEELLVTNKTRLNSNKLMNKILIVQNISKEFMNNVYTEKNFKGLKMTNARLKAPSLEDIYRYYENHCKKPVDQSTTFEMVVCIIYISYLVCLGIILMLYINIPSARLLLNDSYNKILQLFDFINSRPEEDKVNKNE
jgi:formylmethanofuran dehydrogenase subunit E